MFCPRDLSAITSLSITAAGRSAVKAMTAADAGTPPPPPAGNPRPRRPPPWPAPSPAAVVSTGGSDVTRRQPGNGLLSCEPSGSGLVISATPDAAWLVPIRLEYYCPHRTPTLLRNLDSLHLFSYLLASFHIIFARDC